jgi:hypothetical protein
MPRKPRAMPRKPRAMPRKPRAMPWADLLWPFRPEAERARREGGPRTAHGVCLLVRLQLYRISRVKVSAGVLWHSVTKSNCVAARRGGKQLEVND